ncbi:UDP-N-acetylmuramoyl-L-alanyl-D-glutamate--2,6-diaminopimelate ligase [Candidatus Latescibacterota bacterium]
MKLSDLIDGIEMIASTGDLSSEIVSIEYNSRKVKDGSLFIAVQGFTFDGNSYIEDAVKKGAAGIVTDIPDTKVDVPAIIVADTRKAMAFIADRFYGSPQNSIVMTAVTGTNGKTTVTYMIKSIFEASGIGCGLIGTIGHIVGNETIESLNTTPESIDIHSMLSKINNANQHACAMEVSSHALALSRVHGIQFRAAAFTNISRDHLDFHGDFNDYLDAKSTLFSTLSGDSTAVVNLDDPNAEHIINVSRGCKILTFGFNKSCEIHPVSYELGTHGSDIVLSTPAGQREMNLPIPGKFNISNAMAAVGIGLACGLQLDEIAAGLESLKSVRGRYENIDEGQDYSVIIDYAHTPDALENILSSVREITKGRLISVFGCGGDRDKGKRPEMGEISTRLADYTIITSDNPRTENPEDIVSDIIKGVVEKAEKSGYKTVVDRESGISEAINMARADDSIVIAGKGHEDYQIIGREKRHFDDSEIVRSKIKAKNGRL